MYKLKILKHSDTEWLEHEAHKLLTEGYLLYETHTIVSSTHYTVITLIFVKSVEYIAKR